MCSARTRRVQESAQVPARPVQVFEEPHLDSVGEAAERFRPRTEARRPPGVGFADRDDSALVSQQRGDVGCDDGRALVAERAREDAAEVLLGCATTWACASATISATGPNADNASGPEACRGERPRRDPRPIALAPRGVATFRFPEARRR